MEFSCSKQCKARAKPLVGKTLAKTSLNNNLSLKMFDLNIDCEC